MPRRYAILDVFTDRALAGNPLAVVLGSEGLDDAAMQAIAKEFNLSETVFVRPPESPRHRASLRIFTPGRELPFAGHPTVGAAVLLALEDRGGGQPGDALAFGLEERVGTISCVVETDVAARAGTARFVIPRLPEREGEPLSKEEAARLLGLEIREVGFERHAPSRYTAGNPFDFIPVASLDALGRIALDPATLRASGGGGGHVGFFIYTRDGDGRRFRARMLAPGSGITEDPATGSAAAAFAGVLMQFEPLGSGEHGIEIGQGYEMGRPSEIALQMTITDGALASAEIGGGAVVVAHGELFA